MINYCNILKISFVKSPLDVYIPVKRDLIIIAINMKGKKM